MTSTFDLAQIDLIDPDVYAERVPWDWFEYLRREHPVFWHPEQPPNHGFWSVMRHHDLDRAERGTA